MPLRFIFDLQWLEEKYGTKSRRGWRKLHLAVDADSGEIIAHSLTHQEAGDASQLEPLLDQIEDEIGQFAAGGAFDGTPTYEAVLRHSEGAKVVIPPRSNAVERPASKRPARETTTWPPCRKIAS